MNKETKPRKYSVNVDELKLKMLQLKAKLKAINYTAIYQYEYGTLDDKGLNHLRDVWNTKCADQVIINRFEQIAENLEKMNSFKDR